MRVGNGPIFGVRRAVRAGNGVQSQPVEAETIDRVVVLDGAHLAVIAEVSRAPIDR